MLISYHNSLWTGQLIMSGIVAGMGVAKGVSVVIDAGNDMTQGGRGTHGVADPQFSTPKPLLRNDGDK